MMLKLYDANSVHQLQWPTTEMAHRLKGYWLAMMRDGTDTYIRNVHTQLYLLQIEDQVLPITVNDAEYENAYVCSFYAHYITYTIYELTCLGMPKLEKLLAVLLRIIGLVLKVTKKSVVR